MGEERVSLSFDSFEQFLDSCSDRVSEEGLFVPTDASVPVGGTVQFELGLDSDFPILRGTGEVVRVVGTERGGPGLELRYREPDEATLTLARRIVERQRGRDGTVFELGLHQPIPIGSLDLPKIDEAPMATPTQAINELIVPADESAVEPSGTTGAEAVGPGVLDLPSEVEPEGAPPLEPAAEVEVHPWETVDEPKGRGRRLWPVLAVLALGAAAGYWQRDALRSMFAGAAEAPASAAAESVEPAVEEPVEAEVAEPMVAEPMVAEPAEVAAVEPEAASIVEESEPLDPLTRIEQIRWTTESDATILELVANGAVADDGYSVDRLADPPRLVVKIAGVVAPLARPNLAVGSSEVVGVRTGLHGTPPASTLHVVVDLADPTAQADSIRIAGPLLQVRVASGAVSP